MMKSHFFGTFLLGFFFVGFLACKSTEVAQSETSSEQTENESWVDDGSFIDKEAVPSPQITVLINDRIEFQFAKHEDGWQGSAVEFQFNEEGIKVPSKYYKAEPKLGWTDFEEVIHFLKIYQLNDQSELEDREVGSLSVASRSYQITIRNDGEVKSLFYYNPEGEILQNWQTQSVATFGTYLATEMNVYEK